MGRKSREAAQKRHAKRRAEAAGPPVPAKKPRVRAKKPEHQELDNVGSANSAPAPQHVRQPAPLKLRLGMRPTSEKNVQALTWRCIQCDKINLPRRGLIADYPILNCDCGRDCEIEFDFSIGNVTINDQHLMNQGNVKAQDSNQCVLAATTSGLEITLQVRNILSGQAAKPEETTINLTKLNTQYETVRARSEVLKKNVYNASTIIALACIAKRNGVECDTVDSFKVHKIPGYVQVKNSFYDIVRVLADGHPLITSIIPGKNFKTLKPGQIYKAPGEEELTPGKKSRRGHAILLIGAGRRGKTNYYHFINSWGELFCLEEDGRYGYGMLRASDIRLPPVKFIRYSEEVDRHKKLASTDPSYAE